MSLAWSVFEPRLQRMLKSLDDTTYAPELRADAINASLRALCFHTAKQASVELMGDGTVKSWSLPPTAGVPPVATAPYPLSSPDWFEAVWDQEKEEWLEPVRFQPGSDWSDNTPAGFYMWPQGTFNLTYTLDNGKKITVYYYAYWSTIVDGNDLLEAPDWSWNALLNYAAAYCVAPGGISAARIRQYGTQVDSGNPEHNPVHEQARYHLEQFQAELQRWAPQQRGMMFTPGRAR